MLRGDSAAARTGVAILGVAVVFAIGSAGLSAAHTAVPKPFARQATVVCLKKHGAAISRVHATNRRLRALRDLAQRTSLEAHVRTVVVGLAITRSAADAALLYELLRVPKDPLRLQRVRNVVLLSPKQSPAARLVVISCLRT